MNEPPGDILATIVVYWRPGCGFCSSLLHRLDRAGLTFERVDIWEDEDGAAYVRSVASGNETVPTVRVGDRAFVNPSASKLLRLVAEEAPELLPEGYEPPQPGPIARAVGRLLGS